MYNLSTYSTANKPAIHPPCVLQVGVARGELPEASLAAAAGTLSARLSQRALRPTLATLRALGGSQEVPLPRLFTTQNEEPRLPSQAEILLQERTLAERRERAEVAASNRERRKAFLRPRRAARAESRQHLQQLLEEHSQSLEIAEGGEGGRGEGMGRDQWPNTAPSPSGEVPVPIGAGLGYDDSPGCVRVGHGQSSD
jgi:hypothetical protein